MKCLAQVVNLPPDASHPSRGAWIEIPTGPAMACLYVVAPLTGCVD